MSSAPKSTAAFECDLACFLKSSRAYAGESLRRSRIGRSARKLAARVSGATLFFFGRVGSNFSRLRGSKFGRPSSVRAIFALTASRRFVGRVSESFLNAGRSGRSAYLYGFLTSGPDVGRSDRSARGADSRTSRSLTNFLARESGRCERSIRALRSSGASVGRGFDAVCSW